MHRHIYIYICVYIYIQMYHTCMVYKSQNRFHTDHEADLTSNQPHDQYVTQIDIH
jgi:hypothetical protein